VFLIAQTLIFGFVFLIINTSKNLSMWISLYPPFYLIPTPRFSPSLRLGSAKLMLFFINQTFFIISFKKNLISTLFSSLSTALPRFWVRKGKHSFPSDNTLFLSFFNLFFYGLIYREVRKGRKTEGE
jgi:hypothetical protein